MAQTMKAWFAVPGPEGAVFELRDTPAPTAGPGQVIVAVGAADRVAPMSPDDNPAGGIFDRSRCILPTLLYRACHEISPEPARLGRRPRRTWRRRGSPRARRVLRHD